MLPDGSALGMTDAELDFSAEMTEFLLASGVRACLKFRDWMQMLQSENKGLITYHEKPDEAKKEWIALFAKFKAKVVRERKKENFADRDEEPPDEYEAFVKKQLNTVMFGE